MPCRQINYSFTKKVTEKIELVAKPKMIQTYTTEKMKDVWKGISHLKVADSGMI